MTGGSCDIQGNASSGLTPLAMEEERPREMAGPRLLSQLEAELDPHPRHTQHFGHAQRRAGTHGALCCSEKDARGDRLCSKDKGEEESEVKEW